MIETVLDSIQTRITNAFHSFGDAIFDPLWRWYVYLFVFLVVLVVIGYFLPFKWVRAALGFVLLLAGAYVAGGRQMHGEMKDELDKARKGKLKPVTAKVPDHSIFSNWGQ